MMENSNSGACVEDVSEYITFIRVHGYQLNDIRDWLYARGIEHSVRGVGQDLGVVFRCPKQQLIFEMMWSKHCVP